MPLINTSCDFPQVTSTPYDFFSNEHAFCTYVMGQVDLWRDLGCELPHEYRTNTSPDFLANVRPLRGKSPRKRVVLGVEAELDARSFKLHKHEPWNIHLILSFTCWWPIRTSKEVPIVSFYRKCDDGLFRWSLDDDIGMVYHGRKSELFKGAILPPDDDD